MAGAESGVLEILSTVTPLASISQRGRDALSSVSREVAAQFVRCAYRCLKNNPNSVTLINDVCDRSLRSEYPLSAWLEEIVRVYAWLNQRESSANLMDVVEYVSCAFEGMQGRPDHIVCSYLDSYGFERALPLAQAPIKPCS